MSSVENLKKQAKRLVRWHRARHHPVAAAIRDALPRFSGMSDDAILASTFTLSDAQEMMAREKGFASWSTLLQEIEKRPDQPSLPHATARIVATEASIFVADFERAAAFYTRKLGFLLEFSYGEPPYYGLVSRDAARLTLRLVHEPVFNADIRAREQLLSACFTLAAAADLKALFDAWVKADVPMFQRLRTEPWGARTFIVTDPDGNLILFASPERT
jgi:catechol 2,3-dioxygenase-like lactoylglutathione lyase family enzyme